MKVLCFQFSSGDKENALVKACIQFIIPHHENSVPASDFSLPNDLAAIQKLISLLLLKAYLSKLLHLSPCRLLGEDKNTRIQVPLPQCIIAQLITYNKHAHYAIRVMNSSIHKFK